MSTGGGGSTNINANVPPRVNLKIVLISLGGDVFLTPYVIYAENETVVVDPGPRSCLDQYTEWHRAVAVCTHIHLDHCGSAGDVVRHGGVVYAHARYTNHLVNPERLWQKSLEALRDYAEVFGKPINAEERGVRPLHDGDKALGLLKVVYSPGHAPHHVTLYYEELGVAFVGDGAGVYFPDAKAIVPSTPPPFNLKEYVGSLEKVVDLNPEWICFAHVGCTNEVELLERGIEQVALWVEVVRRGLSLGEDLEALLARLAREDDMLKRVVESSRGGMRRMLLMSSIAGIVDYVQRIVP